MKAEHIEEFFQLLDDACDAISKPRKSEAAKVMFLQVVGSYGIANLKGALMAHMRDPERGRFMPTPADLIEQILRAKQNDGRPSADEAWALAIQMCDESATVVINDEVAQAWSVAREIMPDRTGARMAFRSAYDRLVDSNRKANTPPNWFPSLGHDQLGREGPLMQAVQLGRLPLDQVKAMLPAPPSPTANQIQLLAQKAGPKAEKCLADLKAMFGTIKKIG